MSHLSLPLVLASESPRRRDLLSQAGFNFTVFPSQLSEKLEKNLTAEQQILRFATDKARLSSKAYQAPQNQKYFYLLAADTMVVLDGHPIGKPESESEAQETLRRLSGKTHLVQTALCLILARSDNPNEILWEKSQIETTEITFRQLSENEIHDYVKSKEPMDKAGSYGIQGQAGKFVEKISGEFDNVVGLPMKLFKNLLESSPHIIAVSKRQGIDKVKSLQRLGYKDFAENYVQEFVEKYQQLSGENIRWHFIGKLQTNKIKDIVGKVETIQSCDRFSLVEKINQVAFQKNIRQKIFLQLNLADEATKGGYTKAGLLAELPSLLKFENVEIVGLMTMPPLFEDAEMARPYFKELYLLKQEIQKHFAYPLKLSMGTSHDYAVAIQEHSDFVRLGTVLFGERTKKE